MAGTAPNTTETRETRDAGSKSDTGKSLVVVDLGESQSVIDVKRLRRGRGKLYQHVERIVADLVEAGTVKSNAQPVVIVVRESVGMWPIVEVDD